jgi:ornithine decarboxylase
MPNEPELELDPDQDPFARESIERLVSRFGSPLFLIDAERLRAQYRSLAAALPGVGLYYAIKSLPHPAIVAVLEQEGACFDLATNGEVQLVRRLGVAPGRCIHTHPIKRDCDIRTALDFGVTHFVVDNEDELRKFVRYRNRAALLIRLAFRSDAVVDLSRKFGCEPAALPDLLALAEELRISVVGLSFHAGSQAANPQMHVRAIEVCGDLMRRERERGDGRRSDARRGGAGRVDARRGGARRGHDLSLLDIGGGFPTDYLQGPPCMPIEEFCAPIRGALQSLGGGVRVIAEPGRYLSAPCAVAVASVMGRAQRDGRWWYYLDDGLYGSYSGQMYDHAKYPIEALAAPGPTYPSVLAGPTCDSIDVIREPIDLPKLEQGDLVVGRVMGAYTWASASEFNFFPRATVLALDRGRRIGEGDTP